MDVTTTFFFFLTPLLSSFWTSRDKGVVPSSPRLLPSIFIARRVQQSHCWSIFHRMLLTHALALSASQFEYKKMSQRIYASMHSAGLELTKLTYTGLEDNLIHHRGDITPWPWPVPIPTHAVTTMPPLKGSRWPFAPLSYVEQPDGAIIDPKAAYYPPRVCPSPPVHFG